jgi:tRNA-binding EMAP/Myf-like protein
MTGNCLVMVNLKPRPLAGFMSNGMVVCASNHDHTAVEVLRPKGQHD